MAASVPLLRWALTALIGVGLLIGASLTSPAIAAEKPVVPQASETPPNTRPSDLIGSIDFYGLRKVTPQQVRRELGLKEGDLAPGTAAAVSSVVRRLEKIPGVVRARLERTCCDAEGRSVLFIGIEEKGAPRFRYRRAPRGMASLPPEIVATYSRFEKAWEEAVLKGDTGDNLSQGHSLAANPALRAVQEQFLVHAASHLKTVRHVLRNSRDARQRQMAAWILGYAPDKGEVVADLVDAARDTDEGVRNSATRALAAIAALAQRRPEQGIRMEAAPFVSMLNSLVWSDRNKAAMLLMALAGDRQASVLDQLRRRALPALVEMARWKSEGHAQQAYWLLGRIAGLDDAAIWQAWTRGEREQVIARAVRAASGARSRAR